MVRVLGRVTSINVRKVLWALDEIGEPYLREDWGLPGRDPKVPEFLALNPNGQVPVLIEDDGSVLWESNGLLVYLAQTRGALLPEDRRALGLALQWLGWQASELNPSWGYVVPGLLRRMPGYDDPDKIAEAIGRWTGTMGILERELEKGRPFLAGEVFSVADIAVGLSCHRWFKTPFEKREFLAVREYYERLRGREAGARWMPEDYG
ncbi:glutathione S-transferase family protein [Devosia aurantiaca]|uniref:Glutathione S-transferase family protein n=1 Tax=Devosia aurantiaca TaxID=2714858 RepID=A0A6M1SVR4_9HYPH|nr:glutathione S-transferase family protein [Devosia aurantiaca]NGP18473.1 glutathione S-transferase family protein [Devosia aurantiaca]